MILSVTLASMVISYILIAYGWIAGHESVAIAGAILFVITSAVRGLISTVRDSRIYRRGQSAELNSGSEGMHKVVVRLNGLTSFVGMLVFMAGVQFEVQQIIWPGAVLWVGSFSQFLIFGWIIRGMTGIPLRVGYLGWYVQKPRRNRGRRRRR